MPHAKSAEEQQPDSSKLAESRTGRRTWNIGPGHNATLLSVKLKLSQMFFPAGQAAVRPHVLLEDQAVFQNQGVHVCRQEAAVSILGSADNRLAPDVETGVDQDRAASQIVK